MTIVARFCRGEADMSSRDINPLLRRAFRRAFQPAQACRRRRSNIMTKSLAVFSASLMLIAVSTAANAGSTISDRSYWPNQTRTTGSSSSDRRPLAAFDAVPGPSHGLIADPQFSDASRSYRYQGGPKSPY
jgi:hypothetical protein